MLSDASGTGRVGHHLSQDFLRFLLAFFGNRHDSPALEPQQGRSPERDDLAVFGAGDAIEAFPGVEHAAEAEPPITIRFGTISATENWQEICALLPCVPVKFPGLRRGKFVSRPVKGTDIDLIVNGGLLSGQAEGRRDRPRQKGRGEYR